MHVSLINSPSLDMYHTFVYTARLPSTVLWLSVIVLVWPIISSALNQLMN